MNLSTYDAALRDGRITEAQHKALAALAKDSGYSWPDILARVTLPTALCPYLSVADFHGMYVGIEPDGYTHT